LLLRANYLVFRASDLQPRRSIPSMQSGALTIDVSTRRSMSTAASVLDRVANAAKQAGVALRYDSGGRRATL
jgi:hypothetical protein